MKIEEVNSLKSKSENEDFSSSDKNILTISKQNPRTFSKKNILIRSLLKIIIILTILCFVLFKTETEQNNTFINAKIFKQENEELKDLRENNKEAYNTNATNVDENDEDNDEGKDVNKPLKRKDGKIFEDEDNDDNNDNDNDEPVLERNKIKRIKNEELKEINEEDNIK